MVGHHDRRRGTRVMEQRPYIPSAVNELTEQQMHAAALYVMGRHRENPAAMWEVLEMLGLDRTAQRLLAGRNGST